MTEAVMARARRSAERAAERRQAEHGVVVCPGCGDDLCIRNPSVRDYSGKRLGAAYCKACRKAWRAIEFPGEGWKVVWDVERGQPVGEPDSVMG